MHVARERVRARAGAGAGAPDCAINELTRDNELNASSGALPGVKVVQIVLRRINRI